MLILLTLILITQIHPKMVNATKANQFIVNSTLDHTNNINVNIQLLNNQNTAKIILFYDKTIFRQSNIILGNKKALFWVNKS